MEYYVIYTGAKLEYGGITSKVSSNTLLQELETIQYNAVRIAFGARKKQLHGVFTNQKVELRSLVAGEAQ